MIFCGRHRLLDSFNNTLLVRLLLCLCVMVVYRPALGFEFLLWDDPINTYENPLVRTFSLANLAQIWQRPLHELYIPVTYSLWALIAAASRLIFYGKLTPMLFHTVNVLLHLINTNLVYSLGRRWIRHWHDRLSSEAVNMAALLGALIFALHPVQVEATAWITGMKDLLSAFFSLLAIQFFFAAELDAAPERSKSIKRTLCAIAAGTALLCALLSKPSAVIVPGILVVLLWGIKELTSARLKTLLPWAALSLACAAWTKLLQPGKAISDGYSLIDRFLIAGDTIVFYVFKTFIPQSLISDYGRTPAWVLQQTPWVYLFPILIFFGVTAAGLGKHRRICLSCLAIFVLGFFPVIGLIPFDYQRISTVANRYLYLSLLGPAIATSWFVCKLKRHRVIMLLGLCIAILGVVTSIHLRYWRNTSSLMNWTLTHNPRSAAANLNLGVALMREGKTAESIPHLQKALQTNPDSVLARYNLAVAFACLNDPTSAFHQQELIATVDRKTANLLTKIIPLITAAAEIGKLPPELKQVMSDYPQPDF